MAYLARYQERNKALSDVGRFPTPFAQAGAWYWISELVRRHPGELHVIEGVYPTGDGTVWYLNRVSPQVDGELSLGQVLCRIYELGHVTQTHFDQAEECPVTEKLLDKDDDRFLTIDGALSPEPRLMVKELEECVGLGAVEHTPSTDSTSIGARVIAEAVRLVALTGDPLRVVAGLFDGVSFQRHLFAEFPLLQSIVSAVDEIGTTGGRGADQKLFIISAPWFFLLRSEPSGHEQREKPLAAINLDTGLCVLKGSQVDLMKEFRESDRDLTAVALHLVQRARAASQ